MKILNKYPVLADLIRTGENSFQFKFKKTSYFDYDQDLFAVNIHGLKVFGDDFQSWMDAVREEHLNSSTVLTAEGRSLEIFVGDFDEHPDWGSWGTTFVPIGFETYDTEYILKTQDDWDRELLNNIKGKVSEKMYQSVTDPDFRDYVQRHCEEQLTHAILSDIQKKGCRKYWKRSNILGEIASISYLPMTVNLK